MAVEPAVLSFDAHGAPMSARYGDVYASRDGPLGQAHEVFLRGTECVERWAGREHFVILEAGFGLGINFLAAWQAWRDDPARPRRLHFVSLERHPLPADALAAAAPVEVVELARQLAAQWPLPLAGLHRLEFERGRVVLTVAFGDAREMAPELHLGADALFLDGFAPDRNPEMWERSLLRALARAARPGARVATWSTARAVRDALAESGFEIAIAPGFGRKRQRLVGRFAPRYAVRRHEPPAAYTGARSAVVVGAGLAGAACAGVLAGADWDVRVVDSAPPAHGASALPWGLMHPQFAADDNVLARLTRAGAEAGARALERAAPGGRHGDAMVWRHDGFFQLAPDAAGALRWRAALEALGWPPGHVEWMEPGEARRRLGVQPARGGLWWHGGRTVSPPRWVEALLDDRRIRVQSAGVEAVARAGDGWNVLGTRGEVLAHAALVVVAAALDTPRLLRASALPAQPVPGQVTFIRDQELEGLRAGLGGDGTLLRAPDGRIAVGATYETSIGAGCAALDDRMAARSNLARLERLLAVPAEARVEGRYAGTRCVARDRLPYAGAMADEPACAESAGRLRGAHPEDLPRLPGLFVSFAHGSRGLTFAALAAELIVAQAEGEPWPLERSLAAAIDPARVLMRRLRRGPAPATPA